MLALVLGPSRPAQAQDGDSSSGGTKGQLATILYCGLGGAALGLSTLSFYGRPQNKLGNIAIGFAVGIISGTAYVTYELTTGSQSSYSSLNPQSELESELSQSPPRFARGAVIPVSTQWTF